MIYAFLPDVHEVAACRTWRDAAGETLQILQKQCFCVLSLALDLMIDVLLTFDIQTAC